MKYHGAVLRAKIWQYSARLPHEFNVVGKKNIEVLGGYKLLFSISVIRFKVTNTFAQSYKRIKLKF